MTPEFITHPDFSCVVPFNIFHKEVGSYPKSPYDSLQNRHVLYHRRATLPPFTRATLKITADDYYKLYVNGQRAAQGPAPSYPNAYYLMEIDVTDKLCEGENLFAVHTYYQGLDNHVFITTDGRCMLYFELSLDGVPYLVSDGEWLVAYHTGYTECGRFGYDTQFAECYDGRAPERDFYLPDFDDTGWVHAEIYKHADYTLKPQPTKCLDIYPLKGVREVRCKDRIFLDLGREVVCYLTARASGCSGDEITLRFAEELNPDGSIRYDMRANCLYEEKWILRGDGRDTLLEYDYKAFRYAEIIYPDTVTVTDVKIEVRHYPYEERNLPKSADPQLNAILKLCRDTIKYGTQEQYLDCPTREKGQYLGDIFVSGKAQAILTGDTTMLKKAVREFFTSSFICKGLMAVANSSHMQEIADYSLLIAELVVWIYKFDLDREFLLEAEPYLMGVLEYFAAYEREDGLLESVTEKWNLVDWPDNLRDGYDFPLTRPVTPGTHNVINAFWYGFLKNLDEYLLIIGKSPTGKTERLKAAFYKAFYFEGTGLFTDTEAHTHSAVHSNVLPLYFGLTDGDVELERRISEFIKKKRLVSMGVYMSYFALGALLRLGDTDGVRLLTLDEGAWLNMLREGATTTFEAWGVDQKENTSLFHPWACSPIIIFSDKHFIK